MGIFDDQKFGWREREYAVPANRVLGAIARVEDVVTLQELAEFANKKRAPLGKLSQAYGAVLRYAGADVSDDDVYAGMFGSGATQLQVVQAVFALINMMVPRSAVANASANGAQPPGNAPATESVSSKKRTRSQSAKVG